VLLRHRGRIGMYRYMYRSVSPCHQPVPATVYTAAMPANVKLRDARIAAGLSQEQLALRIQQAGHKYGHPNGCNRSRVHSWETEGSTPQVHYVLLLEAVLGIPAADLGIAYETFGMDRQQMLEESGLDLMMPEPAEGNSVVYGSLSGVWLSTYQYE